MIRALWNRYLMDSLWIITLWNHFPYGLLPYAALWNDYPMLSLWDSFPYVPYEQLPYVTLCNIFLMLLMERLPYVVLMKQLSSCPYGKDSLWLYETFKGPLISWCYGACWIIVSKNRNYVLHIFVPWKLWVRFSFTLILWESRSDLCDRSKRKNVMFFHWDCLGIPFHKALS